MTNIDMKNVNFEVDPLVAHKMQIQMQNNQHFAQMLHTNVTQRFYDYLAYKVKMRENLNLAIKGETRCLAGNTMIHTAKGLKSIKNIKSGDIILSYATSSSDKFLTWMPVTNNYIYKERPTIRIELDDGTKIRCTPNHPLYEIKCRGISHPLGALAKSTTGWWVKAEHLKIGSRLYVPINYPASGKNSISKRFMQYKTITKIENSGLADVYDIHVPQTHNYIANDILSHNSGKSTVALSLDVFITNHTKTPFTVEENICSNESEYYQKVKNAKFNTVYHIDEQKEAKFGSGSFREEMGIMDIQNIIAKQCVHTIWLYPSDFIARNSVYGLETYGKDLKNKLVRCLLYDVRKSMMGLNTPLGYVIIPKFQDPAYQKLPESKWSEYRRTNKYELNRTDFDSTLEERYEQKKDNWITQEKNRETGFHHQERFKLGVWLGQQEQFLEQTAKAKQRILARNIFRDLTEAEVDEVVEIARMGISQEDIDAMINQHRTDEKK